MFQHFLKFMIIVLVLMMVAPVMAQDNVVVTTQSPTIAIVFVVSVTINIFLVIVVVYMLRIFGRLPNELANLIPADTVKTILDDLAKRAAETSHPVDDLSVELLKGITRNFLLQMGIDPDDNSGGSAGDRQSAQQFNIPPPPPGGQPQPVQ